MPKIRKISRTPAPFKNWYVIDACFLANRFIPRSRAPAGRERNRIEYCREWWKEIEAQLKRGTGRVYVPDICIAETFKVLAKKYYQDSWFRSSQDFHYYRRQLRDKISIPKRELRKANRKILYHDVESNRDIIIAVDRFYESFFNAGKTVQLADLLVVATAKYLIDFFDAPRSHLHIVTLDKQLRDGAKTIAEIPNAYDPTLSSDRADKVFLDGHSKAS